MKNKIKINNIIIISLLITIFSCSFLYSKNIDLNGLKIGLVTNVSKETVNIGKSVNAEKQNEEEKTKNPEDKYVKVELIIKNNNPYESANVTVEEIAPTGFRQLDSSKNEKIININLESKSEKKIEYTYRYHQSFLKEQNNSIIYDDDGNIIDNSENINLGNDKTSLSSEDVSKQYKLNTPEEDLKKGVTHILIFLLMLVGCVILLYVFRMLYKTIKGNDDNFYNDNDDKFMQMCIFLVASLIFSIIYYNDKVLADKKYVPQVYEYGKTYEKVIYEPVYFNDGLYRFAYKISFSYESSYELTDEDYEKDTDGDSLIDAFEYQYMTDKYNVDTDNDGINDYIEVMFLDYNPLSDDTFNDGIKDGDRDYDNDGLTNIEEINHGTDLFNVDTDYDTISDYDEINKYNTDPLNIDTDEDLLSDPDELKLGLDPNNPRTDGVTLDSERKIEQVYTMTNVPEDLRKGDIFISRISGSISGNIDNEIKITKKNEEVFNSMSSFVQSGFRVALKENERIDIELDVSKVSDRKSTLIIVKYEKGTIEAIDTVCEGNNLKANIGSGTYSVMDSDIVLRDFNIMISDYMP